VEAGSDPVRRTPSLLVTSPAGVEREFVLAAPSVTIGRSGSCDVVLDDPNASRQHARITIGADGATVEDLGSTNGTWRGGARLEPGPSSLANGDELTISRTRLRWIDPEAGDVAPDDAIEGEERATLLTQALATGIIGRTLAAGGGGLDCAEADAALLRCVVAPVTGPRLVVREEEATREIPLDDRAIVVGRSPEADLRLRDPAVSARHARIERRADGYRIEDLGSSNGMLVNGARVARRELRFGDAIRLGSTTLVFKDGAGTAGSRPGRRLPVVLVPGFGGSELHARGERLWPNVSRLIGATERRLRDYWEDASVGSIIRDVAIVPGLFKLESFGRLVAFLTEELGYRPGEDLLEFPYDWRRDNRETARALAAAIAVWRRGRPDPAERVVVLAHSMGGLVSRYYVSCLDGGEAVEQAIFLGTPHEGSPRSLLVAVPGDRGVLLGLLLGKLHVVLRRFPALYQLLPRQDLSCLEDGCPFDAFADCDWLDADHRAAWESAREFRRELSERACPAELRVTSVFGYGRRTLAKVTLRRDAAGRAELVSEEYSRNGDGTVLESSAVLDRSAIHPVDQEHGVLHADRDVLRRIRFELTER
jgi:pSer/pThr/pTyr-binding forkhead associated (FHA) protein